MIEISEVGFAILLLCAAVLVMICFVKTISWLFDGSVKRQDRERRIKAIEDKVNLLSGSVNHIGTSIYEIQRDITLAKLDWNMTQKWAKDSNLLLRQLLASVTPKQEQKGSDDGSDKPQGGDKAFVW